MKGRRPQGGAAAELQELVARLEQSGLAERREDVRHLLEHSRLLLREARRPRAKPAMRWGVMPRLLEALLLAAFLWGVWGAMMRGWGHPLSLLALAAPGLALLWRSGARELLREAGSRLLYALAWGGDWVAEAFSASAMHRLAVRSTAWGLMRAWRRHARAHPSRPGLREVEAFLELTVGPRAAAAFRRAADDRLGRDADRLATLRWSVLIRLFEQMAVSGALAPDIAPPEAVPLPEIPVAFDAESAGATSRRPELAELIRRKRQDIATAHGWPLKSVAEVAQRDAYLRQLREEVAALERELTSAGR
ncbi:hypothetical protein [Roseococcus pinisoli]|uniref:DUF4129 domain-containing protein n=1 Tax=Roseococcus pinisoli TaxID=2835040 RepID=A0ABS5Q7I9_9PROT|nr:hypothetical protein [Roseococcus pinisoli]MBS7809625.1 hypothetical protein [Roseococcus pinisoli]